LEFFNRHNIRGVKYEDWSAVAKLMADRKHLTSDGLKKIIVIKAGMNKGRA
jgi:hypothetical protein